MDIDGFREIAEKIKSALKITIVVPRLRSIIGPERRMSGRSSVQDIIRGQRRQISRIRICVRQWPGIQQDSQFVELDAKNVLDRMLEDSSLLVQSIVEYSFRGFDERSLGIETSTGRDWRARRMRYGVP